MPSRKRNKGQERKLKAQQSELAKLQSSTSYYGESLDSFPCRHGFPRYDCKSSVSRPLGVLFCDIYREKMTGKIDSRKLSPISKSDFHNLASEAFDEVILRYPGLLRDEADRKIAITYTTAQATEAILGISMEIFFADSTDLALMFLFFTAFYANAVLSFESMKGGVIGAKESLNYIDMLDGCRMSLMKFFVKRSPCSCLKEKYAEMKMHQSKTGVCGHCKGRFQRKDLLVCTRCERRQYCSKECQVSDWHKHKMTCDLHRIVSSSLSDESVLFKSARN